MKANTTNKQRITIHRNSAEWLVTEVIDTPEQASNRFAQLAFVYRWQARQYARTRRLATKSVA